MTTPPVSNRDQAVADWFDFEDRYPRSIHQGPQVEKDLYDAAVRELVMGPGDASIEVAQFIVEEDWDELTTALGQLLKRGVDTKDAIAQVTTTWYHDEGEQQAAME